MLLPPHELSISVSKPIIKLPTGPWWKSTTCARFPPLAPSQPLNAARPRAGGSIEPDLAATERIPVERWLRGRVRLRIPSSSDYVPYYQQPSGFLRAPLGSQYVFSITYGYFETRFFG
jgi:hypothetical protein